MLITIPIEENAMKLALLGLLRIKQLLGLAYHVMLPVKLVKVIRVSAQVAKLDRDISKVDLEQLLASKNVFKELMH